MKSHASRCLLICTVLLAILPTPPAAFASGFFPQHPTLTPDASRIVFSAAGDLWSVPVEGGSATRLTADPALDSRALVTPDGTRLVFESARNAGQNLFVAELSAAPGSPMVISQPEPITHVDRPLSLSGVTNERAFFASYLEPSVHRDPSMHTVALRPAGLPTEVPAITPLTRALGSHPNPTHDDDGAFVFVRGRSLGDRPLYRGEGASDIFRANADGTFDRLTDNDLPDHSPRPLPDGSVLFLSSRDGVFDVYRLSPGDDGFVTRLTSFVPGVDGEVGPGVRDLGVSHDGTTAVFCVWDGVYTLDLTRRNPEPVRVPITLSLDSASRPARTERVSESASEAVLSPDGNTIAVVARGDLYVRSVKDDRPTARVTASAAREGSVVWSPDGGTLYFVSDREGSEGIYGARVRLSRADLEREKEGESEDKGENAEPGEGDDGGAEGQDGAPAPSEAGEPNAADHGDRREEDDAEQGGSADEEELSEHERWETALLFDVEKVVDERAVDERGPVPSPDGERLLYTQGRGELVVLDLASGDERVVWSSWNEPGRVAWVGDSEWIVYNVQDLDYNSDVFLLDTGDVDAEPVNITRHPDYDSDAWVSSDGKVLTFASDRGLRRNWDFELYRVYLDESLESLAEYELSAYFEEREDAEKKRKPLDPDPEEDEGEGETGVVFDTRAIRSAYRRVSGVGSFGDVSDLCVTPGGDRMVFSATIDGSEGLWSVDRKGEDRKKLAGGSVDDVRVHMNGTTVSFVQGGHAHTVGVSGGEVTRLAIDAHRVVDIAAHQHQKLGEVGRVLARSFYDSSMRGLDWRSLVQAYSGLAQTTRTTRGFNRVAGMLFGELNASHMGMFGGDAGESGEDAAGIGTGYLGVRAEPAEDGWVVRDVVEDGPAERAGLGAGDVLTSVNGVGLVRDTGGVRDLHAALAGASGNEVLLVYKRGEPGPGAAEGEELYAVVVPIGWRAWETLVYERGVRDRRALVDTMSEGRLGYLHIRSMNESSAEVYERDLYAAASGKEGLVIDVRDNGGGWTTDVLLASLTAPVHAWTMPAGVDRGDVPRDAYPRDRRLIYGYSRPIVVICNEDSFSNAEIFAHAVKTTGRGRLVGRRTFGGVISTGSHELLDGSRVRVPLRGWYVRGSGEEMENNGAKPDVVVWHGPEHEVASEDPQLDRAVEELLGRVGGR